MQASFCRKMHSFSFFKNRILSIIRTYDLLLTIFLPSALQQNDYMNLEQSELQNRRFP
uniref:Uncharacterized protein n=1 Tax=Arundo donax TaxID=35708 RepID=A0A0A9GD06_ARUDO